MTENLTDMTQEARKFVEFWTYQRGLEKGEDQKFWNSLLSDVLGVADVTAFIQYQVPVHAGGTTKFLDAWIPSARVLIEHKTRGVDLSAPPDGHAGRITLPDGESAVGRGVLDAPPGGHAGRITLPDGESAVGRGGPDAPSGLVGSRVPRDRDEPRRREGLQGREGHETEE